MRNHPALLDRLKAAAADRERAFDEARSAHGAWLDSLDTGDLATVAAAYAVLNEADAIYAAARKREHVAAIAHREGLRSIEIDATVRREGVGR